MVEKKNQGREMSRLIVYIEVYDIILYSKVVYWMIIYRDIYKLDIFKVFCNIGQMKIFYRYNVLLFY